MWDFPTLNLIRALKLQSGAILSIFIMDDEIILSLFKENAKDWISWLEIWDKNLKNKLDQVEKARETINVC